MYTCLEYVTTQHTAISPPPWETQISHSK